MKTFLFVLMIIVGFSLYAQEKDSSFCHYGFVMDYNKTIADEFGIKYRQTKSTAFFLKGSLSTEKPIRFNGINYSSQEFRTYGVTIGVEYEVYSVDKISFYVVVSGGLKISDFVLPYYAITGHDLNIVFLDDKEVTRFFESGLGVEYSFSDHLSIGCSQTLSFEHHKGMVYADSEEPVPSTSSSIKMGNTKFTLSFYF